MGKIALITGIGGQDGSYLAEHLLSQGYEVHGLVRRASVAENQNSRIQHLGDQVTLHYGDLTDPFSLLEVVGAVQPAELYNLASQSHVRISFDVPYFTLQTNGVGVLNVLEAVRRASPGTRMYQASSITYDTPVLIRTCEGIRRVTAGECVGLKGFEIFSYSRANRGEFLPVSDVLEHGHQQVYRVKLRGKGEIKVTADHSLFAWRAEGPVADATSELRPGDYLAVYCAESSRADRQPPPVEINYTLDHHIPSRWTGTCRIDSTPQHDEYAVTPELARLVGYYLAEGYCDDAHRRHRVTWTFGEHGRGKQARADAFEIIKRVFGKEPGVVLREGSSANLTLSGKGVAAFFGLCGHTAHTKRIPYFMWDVSHDVAVEFMRGYSQDAKVTPEGEAVYSTVNKELQLDILWFARVHGMPSRPFERYCEAHMSPQGTMIAGAHCHDVHMPRGYVYGELSNTTPRCLCVPSEFARAQGVVRAYKKSVAASRVPNNPFVGIGQAEIESIEPALIEPVMDFVVPGAERFFCGNVPILAHNSSEMFGSAIDDDGYQRETTPMHPTSPYGCAKLMGYSLVRHYRRAYNMFAANGILHNHESGRRGSNFVTQKVVKSAVEIKLGKRDVLWLGNMDAKRDWGHSRDYVQAMHLILNHIEPDDFSIATGETHSVRDMCLMVFDRLGLDYKQYVKQDPRLLRPQELPYLRGDASKARLVLGWYPQTSFEELMAEMVDAELERQGG